MRFYEGYRVSRVIESQRGLLSVRVSKVMFVVKYSHYYILIILLFWGGVFEYHPIGNVEEELLRRATASRDQKRCEMLYFH